MRLKNLQKKKRQFTRFEREKNGKLVFVLILEMSAFEIRMPRMGVGKTADTDK